MRECMVRILFLFEQQGIQNIVLSSFGTGVFCNNVSMIADIRGAALINFDLGYGNLIRDAP